MPGVQIYRSQGPENCNTGAEVVSELWGPVTEAQGDEVGSSEVILTIVNYQAISTLRLE